MFPELTLLLQKREEIIADHAWRDRDQKSHLDALIKISEEIEAWRTANRDQTDARLAHYLENASYGKALSHLVSKGAAPHHP